MGLIAVVPTVIIPIAGPVVWDAAAAITLKLSTWAGVTTACFITVVTTVIIWKTKTVIQHPLSPIMRRSASQGKKCTNMQKKQLLFSFSTIDTVAVETMKYKVNRLKEKSEWWQKLHRSDHAPWGNVPSTDTLSFTAKHHKHFYTNANVKKQHYVVTCMVIWEGSILWFIQPGILNNPSQKVTFDWLLK